MRILLVNKFYYPKGGADRHFFAMKELLEQSGHEVVVFSMDDTRNLPSPYSDDFVSHVDFENVRWDREGVRVMSRMFSSKEAQRKLDALVTRIRPDIAHLHNIYHQLSPSILSVLRRHRIPTVMTLHDFKLISPNYNLYAHGGICMHGVGGNIFACIRHRCIKNSFAASTLAALEMTLQTATRMYERNVDIFLSPSRFLLEMVKKYDPAIRDIRLLPLFSENTMPLSRISGEAAVYLGRLSEEKGVADLLEAAQGLTMPIHIAGDGPLKGTLERKARDMHLDHVKFLGFQSGKELQTTLATARCIVLPSRCYENFPLSILDAYSAGKPVIAAGHGGMRELVEDGVTGLQYAPGSSADLHRCLARLSEDQELAERMGQAAYERSKNFTATRFLSALMNIYEELLAKR